MEEYCLSCKGDEHLEVEPGKTHGRCECPKGLYRPKVTPPATGTEIDPKMYACKPCGKNCTECNEEGKCERCEWFAEPENERDCKCGEGYNQAINGHCAPDFKIQDKECHFDEAINTQSGECEPCKPPCLTCTQPRNDAKCITCLGNHVEWDDSTKKCKCDNGYYMHPEGHMCKPCVKGCKVCKNDFSCETCADNTNAFDATKEECPCQTDFPEWSPKDLECGPVRGSEKCAIHEFWNENAQGFDKCEECVAECDTCAIKKENGYCLSCSSPNMEKKVHTYQEGTVTKEVMFQDAPRIATAMPLFFCKCKPRYWFKIADSSCMDCAAKCEKCTGTTFADCLEPIANAIPNSGNTAYVCEPGHSEATINGLVHCKPDGTDSTCKDTEGWYNNPNKTSGATCEGCAATCDKCPVECKTCEIVSSKLVCKSCHYWDPNGYCLINCNVASCKNCDGTGDNCNACKVSGLVASIGASPTCTCPTNSTWSKKY